jgi:pimeloyl-ACP methyl ester carboxylesterase
MNFWITISLSLVVLWGIVRYVQRILTFHPPQYKDPLNPSYESLVPIGNDSHVHVRYLFNPNNHYVLFYSHGNAADLSRTLPFSSWIHRNAKLNVFEYEYPGYGHSTGVPTESGVMLNAEAALRHLVHKLEVSPERIIIMGTSLGTCPSLHLAANGIELLGLNENVSFKGLILVTPLLSIVRTRFSDNRIVQFIWNLMSPLCDTFNTFGHVSKIKCKTLVIHGTRDSVVPYWHGLHISKALRHAELITVPNADHNDVLENYGYYEFINTIKHYFGF